MTCTADSRFYGRCNYEIYTHMKILSIDKYKISVEKTMEKILTLNVEGSS